MKKKKNVIIVTLLIILSGVISIILINKLGKNDSLLIDENEKILLQNNYSSYTSITNYSNDKNHLNELNVLNFFYYIQGNDLILDFDLYNLLNKNIKNENLKINLYEDKKLIDTISYKIERLDAKNLMSVNIIYTLDDKNIDRYEFEIFGFKTKVSKGIKNY